MVTCDVVRARVEAFTAAMLLDGAHDARPLLRDGRDLRRGLGVLRAGVDGPRPADRPAGAAPERERAPRDVAVGGRTSSGRCCPACSSSASALAGCSPSTPPRSSRARCSSRAVRAAAIVRPGRAPIRGRPRARPARGAEPRLGVAAARLVLAHEPLLLRVPRPGADRRPRRPRRRAPVGRHRHGRRARSRRRRRRCAPRPPRAPARGRPSAPGRSARCRFSRSHRRSPTAIVAAAYGAGWPESRSARRCGRRRFRPVSRRTSWRASARTTGSSRSSSCPIGFVTLGPLADAIGVGPMFVVAGGVLALTNAFVAAAPAVRAVGADGPPRRRSATRPRRPQPRRLRGPRRGRFPTPSPARAACGSRYGSRGRARRGRPP